MNTQPRLARMLVMYFLALGVASVASAGAKKDWQSAQTRNSLEAYQQFLAEYPDSKYAGLARDRIAFLRVTLALNAQRLTALKGYGPGVTTEASFFADGWSGRDPAFGRLGIIGVTLKGDRLELRLGTLSVPFEQQKEMAEVCNALIETALAQRRAGLPAIESHIRDASEVCRVALSHGTVLSVQCWN